MNVKTTFPMKKNLLPVILLALLASFAGAQIPWREFKSADGTQKFVGQLLSYKKADESVTVRLKANMKPATFKLERLSEDDRAYVMAEAANLAANASVELRFDKLLEPTNNERSDTTRTKTYNGGYKVEMVNRSAEWLEDVEVQYVVIYYKDQTDGNGKRMLHGGSKHFDSLLPNSKNEVLADGIEMENFFKEGTAEERRDGTFDAQGNRNTTLKVTKAQKSRDVLLGCVARVKVAGKIVHTEASSPDIMRQYRDSFEAAAKEPAKPAAKGK
jgi:hypothetical protein